MTGLTRKGQIISSGKAISGGDLVVSLYEVWGKRWLVDRLLSLAEGSENDWLEFKATFCPPEEFQECYSRKRDSLKQYVKGDYYLHVVRAVISLINCHGGAVLLGVAQPGKGMPPIPSDHERLCENDKSMPALFNGQYSGWDTDAWLLYIKNIFQKNEWIDRYGTIWNCTETLDDQYIRLYNGILHGQPVAVIAVFPTKALPVELTRLVHIGRHSNNPKKGKPEHCIRRAASGGSCHWPHDDPEAVKQVLIPIRLRGNIASVDMKKSFTEIAKIWESHEPLQDRFNVMAQKEKSDYEALPFGFTSALELVLFCSLSRADAVTSRSATAMTLNDYHIKRENKSLQPIRSHLELTQHVVPYAWLTGSDMDITSSISATLCREGIYSYKWGDVIPVYLHLPAHLDASLLNRLFEEKRDFISKYLLPRLASPASTREHWNYMAGTVGLHLVIDNLELLPKETVAAFLRSVRFFKEQYFYSFLTIVSGPNEAHVRPYYERFELTKEKP
jgi:hypothetical protein